MSKTKYIRTSDDQIVVFSEYLQHSIFKNLNPVSAGYISFYINTENDIDCTCYGESISLKLKSDEKDSQLARKQILGYYD